MKMTVDLPEGILERTKIAAARRRTSIKSLIIEGLETVLREEVSAEPPAFSASVFSPGTEFKTLRMWTAWTAWTAAACCRFSGASLLAGIRSRLRI